MSDKYLIPATSKVDAESLTGVQEYFRDCLNSFYTSLCSGNIINKDENLTIVTASVSSITLKSGTLFISGDGSLNNLLLASCNPDYDRDTATELDDEKIQEQKLTCSVTIPISSSSPIPICQIDGTSLLQGSLAQNNIVWLVETDFDIVPALNQGGSINRTENWKSLRVAITTSVAYFNYIYYGTTGSLPSSLREAWDNGKAMAIAFIKPVNNQILEDSISQREEYLATTLDTLNLINSNPFSMIDYTFRDDLYLYEQVLGTFPSEYILRRTSTYRTNDITETNYFGEIKTENVPIAFDSTGRITRLANYYYVEVSHFPYQVISVKIGSKDYSSYASIVDGKKYISLGDMEISPVGTSITVCYTWMNVAEPTIITAGLPDKIFVNQSNDKELIIAGGNPIPTIVTPISHISLPYPQSPDIYCTEFANYPLTRYFSIGRDGRFDVVPRRLIQTGTVASIASSGEIYPLNQPIIPSPVLAVMTANSSSTNSVTGYATVTISGIDTDGNPIKEELPLDSQSNLKQTFDYDDNSYWVGRYEKTNTRFKFINSILVTGTDTTQYLSVFTDEGLNIDYAVPVCSLEFYSDGTYDPYGLIDLRKKFIFFALGMRNEESNILLRSGLIKIKITAGEDLLKGHSVYLSQIPTHAESVTIPPTAMKTIANSSVLTPQHLGVVYPTDITSGATGYCIARGIYDLNDTDTLYEHYMTDLDVGVNTLDPDATGLYQSLDTTISDVKTITTEYQPIIRPIIRLDSGKDLGVSEIFYLFTIEATASVGYLRVKSLGDGTHRGWMAPCKAPGETQESLVTFYQTRNADLINCYYIKSAEGDGGLIRSAKDSILFPRYSYSESAIDLPLFLFRGNGSQGGSHILNYDFATGGVGGSRGNFSYCTAFATYNPRLQIDRSPEPTKIFCKLNETGYYVNDNVGEYTPVGTGYPPTLNYYWGSPTDKDQLMIQHYATTHTGSYGGNRDRCAFTRKQAVYFGTEKLVSSYGAGIGYLLNEEDPILSLRYYTPIGMAGFSSTTLCPRFFEGYGSDIVISFASNDKGYVAYFETNPIERFATFPCESTDTTGKVAIMCYPTNDGVLCAFQLPAGQRYLIVAKLNLEDEEVIWIKGYDFYSIGQIDQLSIGVLDELNSGEIYLGGQYRISALILPTGFEQFKHGFWSLVLNEDGTVPLPSGMVSPLTEIASGSLPTVTWVGTTTTSYSESSTSTYLGTDYIGLTSWVSSIDVSTQTFLTSSILAYEGLSGEITQTFTDCPTFRREHSPESATIDEADYYTGDTIDAQLSEDVHFQNAVRPPMDMVIYPTNKWFRSYWHRNDDTGKWILTHEDLGKSHLFISCPATGLVDTDTEYYILDVFFATKGENRYHTYLSGEDGFDGGMYFSIAGEYNQARLAGVKFAPYCDKEGRLPRENENKLLMEVSSSITKSDHCRMKNPYVDDVSLPSGDFWTGMDDNETTTETEITPAISGIISDNDYFAFINKYTCRFGFSTKNVTYSSEDPKVKMAGFRLYIAKVDYETTIEFGVTNYGGNTLDICTLGMQRLRFFGMPGDKIRFFLKPRCTDTAWDSLTPRNCITDWP